jgi:hypothetical protein
LPLGSLENNETGCRFGGSRASYQCTIQNPARHEQKADPKGHNAMRYMLLIYASEADMDLRTQEERQRAMQGHLTVMDETVKRGVLLGVNPLARTSAATTVRVVNGNVLATDGPFAETREQLAGYYMLDCADLDEAIAWAARIPNCHSARGCIEIRPVAELPAVPDSFRKSDAAMGSIFK